MDQKQIRLLRAAVAEMARTNNKIPHIVTKIEKISGKLSVKATGQCKALWASYERTNETIKLLTAKIDDAKIRLLKQEKAGVKRPQNNTPARRRPARGAERQGDAMERK